MGQRIHVCPCGARYRVKWASIPMRDKDSIECACGRVIERWNGGVSYWADRLPETGDLEGSS